MKFCKQSLAMTLMLIAFILLFTVQPNQSHAAGYDSFQQTVTIAAGTSFSTVVIPVTKAAIEHVVIAIPVTCDNTTTASGSTVATVSIANEFNGSTFTPLGWSNKTLTNANLNTIQYCNASAMELNVDGNLDLTIALQKNQTATRTFQLLFYIKSGW
jgi:ABC-type transport system involved in multi-copper enzyme maturation permease subunit